MIKSPASPWLVAARQVAGRACRDIGGSMLPLFIVLTYFDTHSLNQTASYTLVCAPLVAVAAPIMRWTLRAPALSPQG